MEERIELSNNHKLYFLEDDILLMSGDDALKHFVSGGNHVVINYDSILSLSKEAKKSVYIGSAKRFISDLNRFMKSPLVKTVEKDFFKLNDGSVLYFYDDSNKDLYQHSMHITRKPETEIHLRRHGIKYELPEFLTYGPEVLKKGIIDIDYYGKDPNNLRVLNDIIDVNERIIFNNQIVRINNQIFYRTFQNLSSNKEKTHYFPTHDESLFYLERLNPNDHTFWAKDLKESGTFKPRNLEQRLAMKNLLDPNLEFNFVAGGSGTGKTMLSYVAAINLILGNEHNRNIEGGVKNRIVLFKPNDLIGGKKRDLGFLKGDKYEKMFPGMRSYEDVHRDSGLTSKFSFLELLEKFDRSKNNDKNKLGDNYLPIDYPCLEMDNLIWGRGRTFTNCVVIADEPQDYTPYEMKQLVERMGVGTKLILSGDVEQIDGEDLDENFNGLTYVVKTMIQEPHPRMSLNLLFNSLRNDGSRIMRNKKAPRI